LEKLIKHWFFLKMGFLKEREFPMSKKNGTYNTALMDLIQKGDQLRKEDGEAFQQVLQATWTSNMRKISSSCLEKLQGFEIVHYDIVTEYYMPIVVMEWGRYFGGEFAQSPLVPAIPGLEEVMMMVQNACLDDVMAVRELDRLARLEKPVRMKEFETLNRLQLVRGTAEDPIIETRVRNYFQKFDAPAETITWNGPLNKR
jgi:hypothetical protein